MVTPVAVCAAGAAAPTRPRSVVRGFLPDGTATPRLPAPSTSPAGSSPARAGLSTLTDRRAAARAAGGRALVQRVDQDLYSGYVTPGRPTPGLDAVTPDALPEPDTFT